MENNDELQSKKILSAVSKLMNENEYDSGSIKKSFNALYNYVYDRMPEFLDKGSYIDNASILRDIKNVLSEHEVFTIFPALASRAIYVLDSSSCKAFAQSIGFEADILSSHFFIPHSSASSLQIYAVTYMNNLIELSEDEYDIAANEFAQKNIAVGKLVKYFIVSYPSSLDNMAFLTVPAFSQPDKSIQSIMSNNVIAPIRYDASADLEVYNKRYPNYFISLSIIDILSDIELYYKRYMQSISNKINYLGKDSVKADDNKSRDIIKQSRKQLVDELSGIESALSEFKKMYSEILSLARGYESELEKQVFGEEFSKSRCFQGFTDNYRNKLLSVFFKYIETENSEIHHILELLKASKYKYTELCRQYADYKKGVIKTINFKDCPAENCTVAKIKLACSKKFSNKLIEYIHPVQTPKEFYALGRWQYEQELFSEAGESFLVAYEMGFRHASDELVALAKEHPESGITPELLSQYIIADANYEYASSLPDSDSKHLLNLKIAASKRHSSAMRELAFHYYSDFIVRKLPKSDKEKAEFKKQGNAVINLLELLKSAKLDTDIAKETKNKTVNKSKTEANAVIGLSELLKSISILENETSSGSISPEYDKMIGLTYLHMKKYTSALSYLKNLNEPQACYECGMIYKDGKGVKKDLTKAKHYFLKAGNYKSAIKNYNAIVQEEEEERQRRFDALYDNDLEEYDSSKDYTPAGSETKSDVFCFITTAVCTALDEGDDCIQLNELRFFRDNHILKDSPDGEALVKEYYCIAPDIVKHIDSEPDAKSIYLGLWKDYIMPSFYEIQSSHWKEAQDIYIEMVKSLCEKYQVAVDDDIMQKYSIRSSTG